MNNTLPKKTKAKRQNTFDAERLIGGTRGVIKGKDESESYTIEVKAIAACTDACPAGINVKAYINLIANQKFEEAVDVIREANPFPAVCGRVCTRPCEGTCILGEHGDSIPIRALKRYASDYELARRDLVAEPCRIDRPQKIAIVGAGPAGLTAAVDLIRRGYPVTVFEGKKEPGGMLRYGIPPYRLPLRILRREIDWIRGLGVVIKTSQKIKDPSELLKKGYQAVLIAGGAPKTFALGIAGDRAEGVQNPLEFLKAINSDTPPKVTDHVLVIGAGSTAFDVARSALRLGAAQVTLAYRRDTKEMPANKEEIEAAKAEGIDIVTHAIPKRIIKDNNHASGVEFLKARLGKPDASGRRKPVAIKNSEFTIKADTIFPAIGAMPDVEPIGGIRVTTPQGLVTVSSYGETLIDGIFAAGDVEMGSSSVVEAIGRGHVAAEGIHAFIKGSPPKEPEELIKHIQIYLGTKTQSKQKHPLNRIPLEKKSLSFAETEPTYTTNQAIEEAARCLSCGPCYACPVCLPNCPNKQLIAEIHDSTLLVKAPLQLSETIDQLQPKTFQLKSDTQTLPITLHSLTAAVNEQKCIGCGRCEEACAYRAISNIITKDKQTIAHVNHQACASCSACVSKCPTGAITQGYMTDSAILRRIDTLEKSYPGLIALTSYWSTSAPEFGTIPGTIQLMSVRKISPMFLLRALARTKRGLLIIKPDTATSAHYLPWEESPDIAITNTKKLLTLIGISPDRIRYTACPPETTIPTLLKEFNHYLEKNNLKSLFLPTLKTSSNPFGETLSLLRILSAQSDITSQADTEQNTQKPGKTLLFEACLPLLNHMGISHHLFSLGPTRTALKTLNDQFHLSTGYLPLRCPSKSLLHENNQKELENMVSSIAKQNKKTIKKYRPKQILLPTPESYLSFSEDPAYNQLITALPKILLQKIKQNPKKFTPKQKTIALHPACSLKEDPFYQITKKIVHLLPGLRIIELGSSCGNTNFTHLDGDAKTKARKLLQHAVSQGAEALLCTSPYCETHLMLCQRQGSWQMVDIEITDLYRFLATALEV